jgi:hypothetical protein
MCENKKSVEVPLSGGKKGNRDPKQQLSQLVKLRELLIRRLGWAGCSQPVHV